jgi:hypothetical protein
MMNDPFENWLRTTLQPCDDDSPPPAVDIPALVAQARSRRARARLRTGLAVSAVVLACFVYMAVTPEKIGSRSGIFEPLKVRPDGTTIVMDQFTGEGAIVSNPGEAEEWNQIADRSAAGEEKVVGAEFTRYNGHSDFGVRYLQFDQKTGREVRYSRKAKTPADNTTRQDLIKLLPVLNSGALEEAKESGAGVLRPDERHQVDGVWYLFRVRAFDFPGTGRVEVGESVPDER